MPSHYKILSSDTQQAIDANSRVIQIVVVSFEWGGVHRGELRLPKDGLTADKIKMGIEEHIALIEGAGGE